MTIDLSRAREIVGPRPLTPWRRGDSVRRTATLEASWPDGTHLPTAVVGVCRDLFTTNPDRPPAILGQASVLARVGLDRTIHSIESEPPIPGLSALRGARAGGRLREQLREIAGEQRRNGAPVYQLLDDLSGVSLVAGTAFMAWPDRAPEWFSRQRADRNVGRQIEDVCIGLQRGSRSLAAASARPGAALDTRIVADVLDCDDPFGWHDCVRSTEVSMRRARRVDVWRDDAVIFVDAAFQDSALRPDGRRMGVHEYSIRGTFDATSMTLTALDADPHVLPFTECGLAPANVDVLLGAPAAELREEVLAHLKRAAGCTHLNDAVRMLADLPALIRPLA